MLPSIAVLTPLPLSEALAVVAATPCSPFDLDIDAEKSPSGQRVFAALKGLGLALERDELSPEDAEVLYQAFSRGVDVTLCMEMPVFWKMFDLRRTSRVS